MKLIFTSLALLTVILASPTAIKNEKGKIDMHGGKSQSYGSFSNKFKDANLTDNKK